MAVQLYRPPVTDGEASQRRGGLHRLADVEEGEAAYAGADACRCNPLPLTVEPCDKHHATYSGIVQRCYAVGAECLALDPSSPTTKLKL